jgi:hypothetical protein
MVGLDTGDTIELSLNAKEKICRLQLGYSSSYRYERYTFKSKRYRHAWILAACSSSQSLYIALGARLKVPAEPLFL